MDLLVNGRNLEITTRLHNYVEKKTGKLDKYMPDLAGVHVDLSATNARNALERQVAQITIRDSRGTILRAEERSNDMFASIDAVVDKLYRQISRYRGKQRRKWRSESNEELLVEEPLPLEEDIIESDEPTIVRYKQFTMRPMTSEEALDQIELLGHDFFVFFNADEQAVNVLYRRRDNNYGLLQPDMN
ncbi:MAG: ribosome-associated translation inhibitor RaiA [Chloroflexi bacterium]|nr:ribosome-associated translation inhibitor RaiA [Chloroflexota bacterium]